MKKKILLFLISITVLSCNKIIKDEKNSPDQQMDSLSVTNKSLVSETEAESKNWYDDILADYIKKTDNVLIQSALKNNEQVEWLLDSTEKTDSTNYYIFNIGQDVTDENNTNPRFSSDGWIYIDSLSKKVYEYDLPNERLILWKNKHNR